MALSHEELAAKFGVKFVATATLYSWEIFPE